MTLPDLLRSAFAGLWRQKARTTLTVLGVLVGTTALAFTLALGIGLRAFIENEFKSRGEFWKVNVHAKDFGRRTVLVEDVPPKRIAVAGTVPPARAERIRARLIEKYQDEQRYTQPLMVQEATVEQILKMPGVEGVYKYHVASAQLGLGEKSTQGLSYAGMLTGFEPELESELILGRVPDPNALDECVVSEFALYQLGIRTDAELEAVIAKQEVLHVNIGQAEFAQGLALAGLLTPNGVKAEMNRTQTELLEKIAKQLPKQIDKFDLTALEKSLVKVVLSEPAKPDPALVAPPPQARITGRFRIVGIVKTQPRPKFDPAELFAKTKLPANDVLLTLEAAHAMTSSTPDTNWREYPAVEARVRPGADLEAVVENIESTTGLETTNSLKFYKSVRREVTLISAGLNLFALISMLVASIGITNTLFTSVLERTKEIGIWKSLGARDGHILLLFLIEGTLIGFCGGVLGLMAAWTLSLPADEWVRQLISQQRGEKLISNTVFDWPIWLPFGTVLFSMMLTTLAAIYPARRAARVQPVEALRHE